MSTRIGIQGDIGSTNERAAKLFIERHNIRDAEIIPLRTTLGVLKALASDQITYGTFAWESSRGGLVEETQEAIKAYSYKQIDDIQIETEHVLLKVPDEEINQESCVYVFSHPQALKEHGPFMKTFFAEIDMRPEEDTAYSAVQLASGTYPANSVVIANRSCSELYNLAVLDVDLPANKGYLTKILFVTKAKA